MGAEILEQKENTEAPYNPWIDGLFEPAVLTGMITCLSIALMHLIKANNPSWQGTYFVAGMVLVTIEAISSYRTMYSYRAMRRRGRINDKRVRFRLAEWAGILFTMKVVTYSGKPWSVTLADIHRWVMEPLHFVTMEFLIYSSLAFLIWHITTSAMKAFETLFDPFVGASTSIDPLQPLINRFYCGGVVLILISGLAQWFSRTGPGDLIDLSRPSIKGVFSNVLLYFLLGLILLSRTHLTLHLAAWRKQKLDVSRQLIRRWAQYGFTALAVITLTAFFLPTRYTLGFLTSVKLLLQYGLKGIICFATLLWGIMFFCLKWLMSLFSFREDMFQEEVRNIHELPEQATIEASPSEILYSYIFWIIVFAIFVYLLGTYFKDNPGLLTWIRSIRFRFSWLAWLGRLWQWLKGGVQSAIDLLPGFVVLSPEERKAPARLKRRRPLLSKLSAKEKILYYYLSLLRRAERCGLNRRKDQTPKEFAFRLTQNIPDMDEEVDLLTEAFVHARYSLDSFDDTQASSVRTTWQHIRKVLRKRQKS
jgi:hypothetical protein